MVMTVSVGDKAKASEIAVPPVVSTIIPVLNEASHLPKLLKALNAQQHIRLNIIVSDGGSTDGSPEIAADAGAIVVNTPRGRGAQMNAGARQAQGEYFLFLHADSGIVDTTLLSRAVSTLQEAIAQRGHHRIAGHFRLRFQRRTDGNTVAYRYMEEKTTLNRPYTTNGDQGFLLARRFFEELGGFDESLPFFEDQRLAEKIRAHHGEWITLPGVLETSARRFETEGFHRRYLLMAIIMGMHYGGVEEFFQKAPHVYRAQHETQRLLLTPFFRLIRQIMQDRGLWGSLQGWQRVGQFVRQNSWQLFFFLDVLARPMLGPGRYPAMTFHDRVIGPLINFRIWDFVTASLVFIWVMGILQPFFWLREHYALHRG